MSVPEVIDGWEHQFRYGGDFTELWIRDGNLRRDPKAWIIVRMRADKKLYVTSNAGFLLHLAKQGPFETLEEAQAACDLLTAAGFSCDDEIDGFQKTRRALFNWGKSTR